MDNRSFKEWTWNRHYYCFFPFVEYPLLEYWRKKEWRANLGWGGRCAFARCIALEAGLLENQYKEEKHCTHPCIFGNWEFIASTLAFIFGLYLLCNDGLK